MRDQLFDRVVGGAVFTAAGIGWLFCVPMQLVGAPLWMLTVGGLVFVAVGAWRAFRGWRLRDMRTGAGAEERVGEAIEYALTRAGCAVAHGVTVIAREGDIDHLGCDAHAPVGTRDQERPTAPDGLCHDLAAHRAKC